MDKYILDANRNPVPETDLERWSEQFENIDARRVALTQLPNGGRVSTVFLGSDHRFGKDGPPMLFETMVFNANDSDTDQDRCSTWAEAEAMHARMVAEALAPSPADANHMRR